jgi:hypothetical protein
VFAKLPGNCALRRFGVLAPDRRARIICGHDIALKAPARSNSPSRRRRAQQEPSSDIPTLSESSPASILAQEGLSGCGATTTVERQSLPEEERAKLSKKDQRFELDYERRRAERDREDAERKAKKRQ